MPTDAIVLYLDDPPAADGLAEQLALEGFIAQTVQAHAQFVWALAERRPAAVILGDLPGLPDTLALLRELRGERRDGVDPDVPVIVLSASGGELCELRAFQAGADDFQPITVSRLVLGARLRALIGRGRITRRTLRLTVGGLRLDANNIEASYRGRRLALSRLEFALLHQLASHPDRLFSRDELLTQVWGYARANQLATRTVDAHCGRLRRKLAAAGAAGAIENRRGVGWRLGLTDPGPDQAA